MSAPRNSGVARSLTVCRFVEEGQEELTEFSSRFGRALRGKGSTRSLGSMALTVLPAGCVNDSLYPQTGSKRKRNALPPRPEDAQWLHERLMKVFKSGPKTFSAPVEGIGMKGGDGMTRTALVFILGQCAEIDDDKAQINEIFSQRKLSPPLSGDEHHVTFGEVFLRQLVRGEGDNPYMLLPKRLSIPDYIGMHGVDVDLLYS